MNKIEFTIHLPELDEPLELGLFVYDNGDVSIYPVDIEITDIKVVEVNNE